MKSTLQLYFPGFLQKKAASDKKLDGGLGTRLQCKTSFPDSTPQINSWGMEPGNEANYHLYSVLQTMYMFIHSIHRLHTLP